MGRPWNVSVWHLNSYDLHCGLTSILHNGFIFIMFPLNMKHDSLWAASSSLCFASLHLLPISIHLFGSSTSTNLFTSDLGMGSPFFNDEFGFTSIFSLLSHGQFFPLGFHVHFRPHICAYFFWFFSFFTLWAFKVRVLEGSVSFVQFLLLSMVMYLCLSITPDFSSNDLCFSSNDFDLNPVSLKLQCDWIRPLPSTIFRAYCHFKLILYCCLHTVWSVHYLLFQACSLSCETSAWSSQFPISNFQFSISNSISQSFNPQFRS